MSQKTFRSFNNDLSMNTKAYILLCFILLFLTFTTNTNTVGYAFMTIIALFIVLLIENFLIIASLHPNIWKTIKWTIFFIIVLLVLIGSS